MEVIFSPFAEESLEEIYHFLKIKFTEKEILAMETDVRNFLISLEDGIVKARQIPSHNNYHFALLRSKQVTVYFEYINQNLVHILFFWPNKKDPKLLEKLLNSI